MPERRSRSHGSFIIGVDMGGTRTKLGRLASGGHTLDGFRTRPTGAGRDPATVLGDVARTIGELEGEIGAPALALGLGVPATFTRDGGIDVLPNFAPGWRGMRIADELGRLVDLPVVLVNDARAFALAEARAGAAAGVGSSFAVTLGTGVGGGLVIRGELHLGASGNAGEFGHHVFDPHGPRCGCGSHGCIETYASAPALVASVMRAFVQGTVPDLVDRANGRFAAVTPALIAEAADAGDPICREAIERVAHVLGVGLANVATLVGVEMVVIGGGMAGLGERLFGPIRSTLAAFAPTARGHLPDLVPARLGDGSGALGAALHAADVMAARDGAER